MSSIWTLCLGRLEDDLSPQQFNTWIRPLHAVEESGRLKLLAPNRFVKDFVAKEMLSEVSRLASSFSRQPINVEIEIGGDDGRKESAIEPHKKDGAAQTVNGSKLRF